MSNYQEIVNLNIGGTRFATSWHTLTWVPDTFFTALLSGRIPTVRDETGAIFIDRDPNLFGLILNFLRTRDIDLNNINIRALRHECDYFGITPLSRRLALCDEMHHSSCGDVLFYGYLPPPLNTSLPTSSSGRNGNSVSRKNSTASSSDVAANRTHSRNSSLDLRTVGRIPSQDQLSRCGRGHSRAASLGNTDSHKGLRPPEINTWQENMKVQIIKAHHNWIAVAYTHFVTGYRLTDSCGWYIIFQSPVQDSVIERIALNAKSGGSATSSGNNSSGTDVMLGIASGPLVRLWAFSTHTEPVRRTLIGTFNLGVRVEHLLFVGPQLVALSGAGSRSKAGVWHTSTQHWQTQDVAHLTTYDTAGSFLLLGTATGAINYIDMQKFPLRMKDNDLLVTQLYKDPNQEPITAISVYLTPKTNLCGNWIEIAYGTRYGSVRVIVQHPETVGHGPQLFQTFTVHQSPITKVSLSENYLISVCSEYNHVRSWRVTRFRGMISTQPGTTPKAAFKVLALEAPTAQPHNDCGPYGEQDEEQIFIQKVVPDTDTLYVRLASNGKRVCAIRSVDGSAVSCFVVAECEGALRPRRLLLCGHRSGAAQMWDLTAHIAAAAGAVTQLYKDPNQEPITAISVYLTPKTNLCGNWIEIAYGTRYGSVRVIVQHPETVGHGPQLFQTFTVHQSPITKVSLSENYLISVCSEYNHVRSWRVTRFRGMISTQPGTTPKAAFKVLALEAPTAQPHNDCGPYGEQDEEQIFIQKVVPDTDTLYVRLASNGKRVCAIRSVDGSAVSCFVVAECEGALRPRRLLLCGHRSGAAQMWDLTAHIAAAAGAAGEGEESPAAEGGPTADELVRLLSACDLDAAPHSPSRAAQP